MARCCSPRCTAYPRYGGAGIGVCEAWKTFSAFLADMGPRPPGTSIDRIDNANGYEPGNCRWATPKEQANNRKSNVFIEFQGERRTVAEWGERFGISRNTLLTRIKLGYAPPELFSPPEPGRKTPRRMVVWRDQELCLTELSRLVGVPAARIGHRLDTGWSMEDAVKPPLLLGRAVQKANRATAGGR
jgi:hypothetical protein